MQGGNEPSPRDRAEEREREFRRRLLRRATFYTYGLLALAVLVAVGGSALIAWVLMAAGLPFLETWIVLALFTLAIPAIGQLVRHSRRRGKD